MNHKTRIADITAKNPLKRTQEEKALLAKEVSRSADEFAGYTVTNYFIVKLDAHMHSEDEYPENFTVDTPCGKDCRKAIDAAAELLKSVDFCFGPHMDNRVKVIDVADDCCECMYFG